MNQVQVRAIIERGILGLRKTTLELCDVGVEKAIEAHRAMLEDMDILTGEHIDGDDYTESLYSDWTAINGFVEDLLNEYGAGL